MNELRNLDKLSIENLQCGRITKEAMYEAIKRCMDIGIPKTFKDQICKSTGSFPSYAQMLLADELNDMLEAARKLKLD